MTILLLSFGAGGVLALLALVFGVLALVGGEARWGYRLLAVSTVLVSLALLLGKVT